MKRIVAVLSWCWLAATGVFAQSVSVELALERDQFISGEELIVKVRVTNFSGQTLTLGNEANWLTFLVEGGPNRIVSQRGKISVIEEARLDSATVGTWRVNIAPYFDLSLPGRYTVSAHVNIPQLKMSVPAKAIAFNVIVGTVMWEQDFGIPAASGVTNGPPELRKYALLQVTHEKALKLYFRLTDVKGALTYRVYPIGSLVTFSRPECQVDQFSNLHVLYQTGARGYLYAMINPDGVLLARETHEISNSRPSLRATEGGRIRVVGGARRYAATDLPPALPRSEPLLPADAETRQP